MVLIAILAVGMLSLSSISLRSANADSALTKARSNALMALMLAIGDLQQTTGPDTRITAGADILDQNHPPILGVWRSWELTNHPEPKARDSSQCPQKFA